MDLIRRRTVLEIVALVLVAWPAWAQTSIEDHFRGEDDKIVEQARIRLAHAVLAEATEDPTRLANDALAVMAMARRKR